MTNGESIALNVVMSWVLDDGAPAPSEQAVREALDFLADRSRKQMGAGFTPELARTLAFRQRG